MASENDPPPRPRRERPLRASSRPEPEPEPEPTTPTSPPTGRPVIEFDSPADQPQRADHVETAFAGPTSQRRWTVALRIFLVVPHLVWLWVLSIAVSVAILIAWVVALFTGRVPENIAEFLARVVRYQSRVLGYGSLLLTDEYPPFNLDADDYAIDVVTAPGPLNRLAVLFRFVLVIPSWIVATLALIGAQMIGVVGWLLTLITGRLPTALWEANASVLRYATRMNAFTYMVTAEQPGGLFGDKQGTPVVASDEAPDLPERPRIVRLVLSKAARRIVALFIALAVLSYVGFFVLAVSLGSRLASSYRQLDEAHDRLGIASNRFGGEAQRCAISGGLECLHSADTRLAGAFDRFADEVQDISFPANASPSGLITDAHDCSAALRRMAAANDEQAYGAALSEFQDAAQQFDKDYADVSFDARYE